MLVFRRGAVHIDDEVLDAVVHGLKRRARLDVDQPANPHVVTLGRLTEVHRELTREHDERLLLEGMPMTAPSRARVVAPDVRACVGKTCSFAQFGDVTSRLARRMGSCRPVKIDG